MIFRLNERGYYLLLVQRFDKSHSKVLYKLVKRFWDVLPEEPIVPWTPFRPSPSRSTVKPGPVSPWITAVDCAGNRIAVLIDGIQAISVTDDTFDDGQVGVAFFGHGRALFRDLQVEGSQ